MVSEKNVYRQNIPIEKDQKIKDKEKKLERANKKCLSDIVNEYNKKKREETKLSKALKALNKLPKRPKKSKLNNKKGCDV